MSRLQTLYQLWVLAFTSGCFGYACRGGDLSEVVVTAAAMTTATIGVWLGLEFAPVDGDDREGD